MAMDSTDGLAVRSTRWMTLVLVAWALAILLALGPGAVDRAAAVQRCKPVTKKIYSSPGMYEANVLIVHGNVSCIEARKVIWRALKPGGFWGSIRGWHCDPKGDYDPFIEKCFKENPRQVIKSGKPRLVR